jgi:hypothetical protein
MAAKRLPARLILRRIGGIRRVKRTLESGTWGDGSPVTDDMRKFLTKTISNYEASEKRKKSRLKRKKQFPTGIPVGKVQVVYYIKGKEKYKWVTPYEPPRKGFTNPLTERDGVPTYKRSYPKHRKSPRRPFGSWDQKSK